MSAADIKSLRRNAIEVTGDAKRTADEKQRAEADISAIGNISVKMRHVPSEGGNAALAALREQNRRLKDHLRGVNSDIADVRLRGQRIKEEVIRQRAAAAGAADKVGGAKFEIADRSILDRVQDEQMKKMADADEILELFGDGNGFDATRHDGSDITDYTYHTERHAREAGKNDTSALSARQRQERANSNATLYRNKIVSGSVDIIPQNQRTRSLISPLDIAVPEEANDPDFWSHHGNNKDMYIEAAVQALTVIRELGNGANIDDLRGREDIFAAMNSFWSRDDPITVLKCGDTYVFENGGRHRIAIAQELRLPQIPVQIVGQVK